LADPLGQLTTLPQTPSRLGSGTPSAPRSSRVRRSLLWEQGRQWAKAGPVKSHDFLKSEKNVKYVFSNIGLPCGRHYHVL